MKTNKLIKRVAVASVVGVMTAVSSTAFAAGSGGIRAVQNVDLTTTGRALITPTVAWDNPDSCDRVDVGIVLEDNPSVKSFQAVALTAIASGLNVQPFMVGCSTTPFGAGGTIPIIRNLSIQ